MVFKITIVAVNKGLASNDTTVREIPGPVSKPVYLIQLKISLPLLVNPFYLSLLIDKLSVVPQPFFPILDPELPQSEIQRQKPSFILPLYMITDRGPPVFLRFLDNACPNRVQVYIRQAIDQGLPLIHEHALETVGPEKPLPVVPLVVKPGKGLLYLLHILR